MMSVISPVQSRYREAVQCTTLHRFFKPKHTVADCACGALKTVKSHYAVECTWCIQAARCFVVPTVS